MLAEAMERAPSKSYMAAIGALSKWVSDMEAILQTEKISLASLETMEEQQLQYRVCFSLEASLLTLFFMYSVFLSVGKNEFKTIV